MEPLVTDQSGQVAKAKSFRYAARQPILTADEKLFGYELLFRDGIQNSFGSADGNAASLSVLDASILMGIDVLCDGRRAFINCTRDLLLKEFFTLLPPEQTAVEILETVPADSLVVDACRRLKASGYLIVLDDFSEAEPREQLIELADIIKVDLRTTPLATAAAMVNHYGKPHRRMLAEKVETREEFTAAQKAGFGYFQGYFFRRPELMQTREIPANKLIYLRLLRAISEPELDARLIEECIKGETSLCYRLLRYINSHAFGLRMEVRSVRHAMTILGEREMRRWIRLVVSLVAAQNKPSDLILSALTRARFCELVAPKAAKGTTDLFLLGLLSLMDSILDLPMAVLLEGISIEQDMRSALLGEPSPLSVLFKLMLAEEGGQWEQAEEVSALLQLPPGYASECQWEAMTWARQMTTES